MNSTTKILRDISAALSSQPGKIQHVHDALNRIPDIIRHERAARQREQILAAADRQAVILRQMAVSIENARAAHPLRWGS